MTDIEQRVADLKRISVLSDLSDEQLRWFGERCSERRLAPGEAWVAEGDPADSMLIVVEGELNARRERIAADGIVRVIQAGEVSGMLPFSRMTTYTVTSRAAVASRILTFPALLFPELLRQIPALEARLVGLLTDRVRESMRLDQQREKLMALGKLSAGLAHELNNPAAAVQRSAHELSDRLVALRSLAGKLIDCGLTKESMHAAVGLYRAAIERSRAGVDLDPLAASDREEALGVWLEAHEVERSWVLAGTLAGVGIGPQELDQLAAAAPGPFLPCLIAWMEGGLAAEILLSDIANAAHRISELVAAIKSYSHMDDGQGRAEVDLRREMESTLIILAHKLRKRSVQVVRDFAADLPKIVVYPGELNQVWTNLLDNAADAVAEGGRITIRAVREGEWIRVDICDDGPGIPPEIQGRIWEPFFTTKPLGEGTGLGLEAVQRIVVGRHRGSVSLASVPGETCFTVRLPLAVPASPPAAAAAATAVAVPAGAVPAGAGAEAAAAPVS